MTAMRWRKLGRVYAPTGQRPWARQYAHLPTPVVLGPEQVRVYFAGLDADRFGRIGYVDVDADQPTRVRPEVEYRVRREHSTIAG